MKVYISGMGLVSSLGNTVNDAFGALERGESGVVTMHEWATYKGLRCLVAAPAKPYDVSYLNRKIRRSMSPMAEMAAIATAEALQQAGLPKENYWAGLDNQKILMCMGSTTGSPITLEDQFRRLFASGGPEGQLSTTFFKVMNHSVPSNVALAIDFQGPMISPSSACSTSAQAMILGWELIRSGLYDMVICGGADELHYTSNTTFDVVQAASTGFNDRPDQTPRPFDRDRDGLVCSEGAGVVILESESHLEKRRGKPLAEFCGGAYYCDGTHMSQPQMSAMINVMNQTLKRTSLSAQDIHYVNAHATGTRVGDQEEAKALETLFGRRTPISSLKGHFGHSLAACGAIEVIASVKMIETQQIIATRNLNHADNECPPVYLPQKNFKTSVKKILSNNFAFGGINTSLIISQTGSN
jgi:3-oxoacyl-[acyl-carrier-protein] synthase II